MLQPLLLLLLPVLVGSLLFYWLLVVCLRSQLNHDQSVKQEGTLSICLALSCLGCAVKRLQCTWGFLPHTSGCCWMTHCLSTFCLATMVVGVFFLDLKGTGVHQFTWCCLWCWVIWYAVRSLAAQGVSCPSLLMSIRLLQCLSIITFIESLTSLDNSNQNVL